MEKMILAGLIRTIGGVFTGTTQYAGAGVKAAQEVFKKVGGAAGSFEASAGGAAAAPSGSILTDLEKGLADIEKLAVDAENGRWGDVVTDISPAMTDVVTIGADMGFNIPLVGQFAGVLHTITSVAGLKQADKPLSAI